MDTSMLESCFDDATKRRVASILQQQAYEPRLPAVFPQGVQPNKIVLVVDELVPYFQKDTVKQYTHKILSGSNLDSSGFFDLIRNDDMFDEDNVLYVIIPWLSFFLNGVKVQPGNLLFDKVDPTKIPPKNVEYFIQSLNIAREFRDNPLIKTDYPNTAEFVTSLDPPVAEGPCEVQATAALARRLIHGAHHLRLAVLARTNNSEMLFCGFPAYWFCTSEAELSVSYLVSSFQ